MATEKGAFNVENVLRPWGLNKKDLSIYALIGINILLWGMLLGLILAIVINSPLISIIPANSYVNYMIIGVLLEAAISLVIILRHRDINRAFNYYQQKYAPIRIAFKSVSTKTPSTQNKSYYSACIEYLKKRRFWVISAITPSIFLLLWTIMGLPSSLSLTYTVLIIVAYPFIFLWVIDIIESGYLGHILRWTKPTKKELIPLAIITIVLASPAYFNAYIGMPSIVNNYEHAGYYNSFGQNFSGMNDTAKVNNILDWSTKHFNDMYSGMFSPSFNPMLMGSVWPPALTMRPDPSNIYVASMYELIVQKGNCGESSLASAGLAQIAGIPVRQVCFHGEDHEFTEMFVNGSWITIDPLTEVGNGYNVSPNFYENSWGYKVSYAEALYPNGTTEDLTDRYTDTGDFFVTVIDSNNHTVSNASVTVSSYNRQDLPNRLPMSTNLTKTTDANGKVELRLGDGTYKLTASNDSLTGCVEKVPLNVSENKSITITLNTKNTSNGLIQTLTQNSGYLFEILTIVFAFVVALVIILMLRVYNSCYLKLAVYCFFFMFLVIISIIMARIFMVF